MTPPQKPISVGLRAEEYAALQRFADEHFDGNLSGAIRLSVRLMTGLPVPSWARQTFTRALESVA